MKIRNKFHLKGNAHTREVYLDGKKLNPTISQKRRNHSPDGFSWGYNGSGPSQLALAIVLDIQGEEDGYQELKFRVISKLPIDKDFDIMFYYDSNTHTYEFEDNTKTAFEKAIETCIETTNNNQNQ